jgi:2-haloacid dehalogenase
MPLEPVGDVRAIVFDIFGTTFDWWTGVTRQIKAIAHREGLDINAMDVTDRWRQEFFVSLDSVRTGRRDFAPLDVLHAEGLDRLFDGSSALSGEVKSELVRTWHRLPVWDDVHDGLRALRQRFTLAALSNGGFAQTVDLIKSAGLPFDCVLSAQMSRHYKPDPQVYLTAVEMLDLAPEQLLMVAAHGWDLAGARAVGFRTAYVMRPSESGPHKPSEDPRAVGCDLIVNDFVELAKTLTA